MSLGPFQGFDVGQDGKAVYLKLAHNVLLQELKIRALSCQRSWHWDLSINHENSQEMKENRQFWVFFSQIPGCKENMSIANWTIYASLSIKYEKQWTNCSYCFMSWRSEAVGGKVNVHCVRRAWTESQNHLAWKRPPGSSATFDWALSTKPKH